MLKINLIKPKLKRSRKSARPFHGARSTYSKRMHSGRYAPSGHVKTHDPEMYNEKHVLIANRLKAKGLPVEHYPIFVSKRNILRTYSKHLGEKLTNILPKLSDKKKVELFKKAARVLGKVNAEGVKHSHPHTENFAFYRNRVSLIDFKLAVEVKPNWESIESVYSSFNSDFRIMRDSMKSNAFSKKEAESVISEMVEQYPMEKKKKEFFVKLIMEKLWVR